jgi:small subunit ribosomal protein S17e
VQELLTALNFDSIQVQIVVPTIAQPDRPGRGPPRRNVPGAAR